MNPINTNYTIKVVAKPLKHYPVVTINGLRKSVDAFDIYEAKEKARKQFGPVDDVCFICNI